MFSGTPLIFLSSLSFSILPSSFSPHCWDWSQYYLHLAALIIIFPCLGLFVTFHRFISFAKWIFKTCFRSEKDLITSYGSWALVTGATDGIGKAWAYQLAQRGINLVLVSRSPKKLETVRTEIRANHPCSHIKTIPVDFFGDFSAGLREIEEVARDLDLGDFGFHFASN